MVQALETRLGSKEIRKQPPSGVLCKK
jgi:hypothetical protein